MNLFRLLIFSALLLLASAATKGLRASTSADEAGIAPRIPASATEQQGVKNNTA